MSRNSKLLLAVVSLLALVIAVGACGGDDDDDGAEARGNSTDAVFAEEMVAHHSSAIEMAEIALDRGQSDFVRGLARDIIRAQRSEIRTLRRISSRLEDAGVRPGDLGLPAEEMGMDMDPAELREAEPFDRAFVDMVIPHHQGAIRMARVELTRGEDPALRRIARGIIDAQSREIEEMNQFREDQYGAASPAGAVPEEASGEAGEATTGTETDREAEGGGDMEGMEGM